MTQFPSQPPFQPYGAVPTLPTLPKWSVSAIAGFVLSFLGCTLVGAFLGLILGIVGILDCRGGRRRGMGLAIAALPISLLSASFGVAAGYSGFVLFKVMAEVPKKVTDAIKSGDTTQAAETIREFATVEFNDDVSKDAMVAWLNAVKEKHGGLQKLELNQQSGASQSKDNVLRLNLNGKFVNGAVPVMIAVKVEGLSIFNIDDIEIDASSPRDNTASKKD